MSQQTVQAPRQPWGKLLDENIATYERGRPKRARFIERFLTEHGLEKRIRSVLEEGAFSGKDSLYLRQRHPSWHFAATDVDEKVVEHLRRSGLHASIADALALPFADASFDLTFHSGLIILFGNEEAYRIIEEQIRVTRTIAFVFGHNRHSIIDRAASFIKRHLFGKEIYTFRRFTTRELHDFLDRTGLQGEVVHYDNALENFLARRLPLAKALVRKLGLSKSKYLTNEIVLVLWK